MSNRSQFLSQAKASSKVYEKSVNVLFDWKEENEEGNDGDNNDYLFRLEIPNVEEEEIQGFLSLELFDHSVMRTHKVRNGWNI